MDGMVAERIYTARYCGYSYRLNWSFAQYTAALPPVGCALYLCLRAREEREVQTPLPKKSSNYLFILAVFVPN